MIPFYFKYSSYGSVMEGYEFAEVVLHEIPGLTAPKESIERARYVYLRLDPFVDVLVVKEVLCSSQTISDLAFAILVLHYYYVVPG